MTNELESSLSTESTQELRAMLNRNQRLDNPTARDDAIADAISNVLNKRAFPQPEGA